MKGSIAVTMPITKLHKEAGGWWRAVVSPQKNRSHHMSLNCHRWMTPEVEHPLMAGRAVYSFPIDQAVWSYQIVKKDVVGRGYRSLGRGSSHQCRIYRTVAETAGLEVLAVETELMATARSVLADQLNLDSQ